MSAWHASSNYSQSSLPSQIPTNAKTQTQNNFHSSSPQFDSGHLKHSIAHDTFLKTKIKNRNANCMLRAPIFVHRFSLHVTIFAERAQLVAAAEVGKAADVDRLIKGGANTEAKDEVRIQ
jgi:hypothetical protein